MAGLEVMRMEIRIEDCPDAFCVILRGPQKCEELQRTLRLLQGQMEDKLWVWGEDGVTTALSPAEIVWAEMVDGRRFIYTQDKIYRSAVDWENLRAAGNLMDCFDVRSRR